MTPSSLCTLLALFLAAGCSRPAIAEDKRPEAVPPVLVATPSATPPRDPSPSVAAKPVPAAPVASRFLVIGDSYVFGRLGSSLDESLRLLPERKVWTYGSCGSSPITWLLGTPTTCGIYEHPEGEPTKRVRLEPSRTPALKDLLATVKPDVTVVIMGMNFLHSPLSTAPDMRKLVDVLVQEKSLCFWVGPPELIAKSAPPEERERQHQYFERLYATLATEPRCELIDARKLGVPVEDKTDGSHAGPITAGKLGVEVGRVIEQHIAARGAGASR